MNLRIAVVLLLAFALGVIIGQFVGVSSANSQPNPAPMFEVPTVSRPLESLSQEESYSKSDEPVASNPTPTPTPTPIPTPDPSSSELSLPTTPAASVDGEFPPVKKFPIAMVCYNRPQYLRESLTSLLQVRGIDKNMITVFQDGDNQEVAHVVKEFGLRHFQNDRSKTNPRAEPNVFIANNYRFMLKACFGGQIPEYQGHDSIVIVEDDLKFSKNFLEYFTQMEPILQEDPLLWCVSSWNDSGFKDKALDPTKLLRTNYFIGLGWLMPRKMYDDVIRSWPSRHWDHHLRQSHIRKGRQCLFPEVSRNYNFGIVGSHADASFFNDNLKDIALYDGPEIKLETSHLHKAGYDHYIEDLMSRSEPVLELSQLDRPADGNHFNEVLAVYLNINGPMDRGWAAIVDYFHLFRPLPIRGVTHFKFQGRTVALVAKASPYFSKKPSDFAGLSPNVFRGKPSG